MRRHAPQTDYDTDHVSFVRQASLYVRGKDAIRIMRLPIGLTLLVCGPRSAEHSHHFESEASLDEFWRWYVRGLMDDGWMLHGVGRCADSRPSQGPRRRRSDLDADC